jgi:hypothetical protein
MENEDLNSDFTAKASLNQTSSNTLDQTLLKDPSFSLKDTFLCPKESISSILKNVKSRSSFKTFLAHSLSKFHKYPLTLITLEIFLGVIFVGLPVFLINLLGLFENKIITLFVITIISLIFSSGLLIVRIVDDKIHNLSSLAKWQRNNIFSNFGISLNLLILILPIFFMYNLYNRINRFLFRYDIEEMKISYLSCFLIDIFYFFPDDNKDSIFTNSVKKDISRRGKIFYRIVNHDIFFASASLLAICFCKIIKGILIKIKFFIEYMLFYMILCAFCILNIIQRFKDNVDAVNNWLSLGQFICMSLSLFIYDVWIIHDSITKILKNKEKCFGFQRYGTLLLSIIIIFYVFLFAGTTLILASLILYYINYYNHFNITVNNNNSIIFESDLIEFLLKIGIFFGTLGFTYFYGFHLMKMIIKPISFEFIPSELLDKNYIRPNLKPNMDYFLSKRLKKRKRHL